MRFIGYFLGGPPPPRPGLKTDYATYLRVPARRRAWFHASGAIATKIAPFLVLAVAPLVDAPGWAVAVVLVLAVLQIVTDVAVQHEGERLEEVPPGDGVRSVNPTGG